MEDPRLKAFCLIVETGSFSQAAEARFVTQSAISHIVRGLEEDLGVKLFSRQGKAVVPTRAGKLLYRHAQTILGQYRTMENEINDLAGKVKGPLSLAAAATTAAYLLPEALYVFSKTCPEVRVEVSVAGTDAILDGLLEGRFDLGVLEDPRKDTVLFSHEIAEDEIVPIASDENPLAKKKLVAPRDIVSQPLILPEEGSPARELLNAFLRDAGISPSEMKIAMIAANPELVIQMVQSGVGISFVSKWSVFKAVKDGTIRVLPLSGKRLTRHFHLLTREEVPGAAAARAFSEFLRGYRFFMPF